MMNKTVAALQAFTASLVTWSLSLREPCRGIPGAWHGFPPVWSHVQQLWERAGVIATSQTTKQDLEKWLTRGCPAGVRADTQRHADVWAPRGAACRPANDDEVLFIYFLSHFVHTLSNWRVGWELIDMQSIPFSTTESASNLQAALNHIMVSWPKESCFGGLLSVFLITPGCFGQPSRMLILHLSGFEKTAFCGAEASFLGGLWDPCESIPPKAGEQPEPVCAMGKAVRAVHTHVTPQFPWPSHWLEVALLPEDRALPWNLSQGSVAYIEEALTVPSTWKKFLNIPRPPKSPLFGFSDTSGPIFLMDAQNKSR